MQQTYCGFCGEAFPSTSAWPKACPGCKRTTWKNPLPAAMALVPVRGRHQTRVLCIRRGIEPGRGKIAFPGGFIEAGETWQEAVSRELREETGVKIAPYLFRIFGIHSNLKKDRLLLFAQAPFVLEEQLPAFTPNAEVQELVLLDHPTELAFPAHTSVLEDYLKLPEFRSPAWVALYKSLRDIHPVKGELHPAEVILRESFQRESTQSWAEEMLSKEIFNDLIVLRLIVCLGRLPLEIVGVVGLRIAEDLLRYSQSGDIREATMHTLSFWGGKESRQILRGHWEDDPPLAEFLESLIEKMDDPPHPGWKIIVLDIDGVLNSSAWEAIRKPLTMQAMMDYRKLEDHDICPENMAQLNRIIAQTGAKVVVSSSWRDGRTVAELQELLTRNGFVGEVVDKTPSFGTSRDAEIQAWLDRNYKLQMPAFVVIDDLLIMKDHLIHTSEFTGGLTEVHAQEAIRRLNQS